MLQETVERLLRAAHDRFVLVERGVEEHRHPSLATRIRDEFVESRILLALTVCSLPVPSTWVVAGI